MMRASATQIESFRLFMSGDWMAEDKLLATIRGEFVPDHRVNLGSAFGKVLEDPLPYAVRGGYRITSGGEEFEFGADVMEPCLALMDRSGVFEAKLTKEYPGGVTVATRADQIVGSRLIEHKTTLSSFDFEKYADSYQWRLMADIFQPAMITYHVFCLSEGSNGVIDLRGIESFNLFPYAHLHQDCCDLVGAFVAYVKAKGLDGLLRERQERAA